jgi:hypothetical protein
MPNEPRIPTSTYRVQFNRTFTFNQAREIVPYLHELGISDCYASPYFQARAESLHGYDITDHNKLNAAIGTREEYDAFVAELKTRGMGQVLDFVPNHMGIGEPLNQWWMDVLENGPSSVYAPYFDIDWQPLKSDLRDKVLLPILGDQYGRVLERGELKVRFEGGAFFLNYFEHEWPIAPGTYRHILQIALAYLEPYRDEDFYAEFQSIITALDYLPRRSETDPARIAERAREKEIVKRRLERRCNEAPHVVEAIQKAVVQINGNPGDARSFDALDRLLDDQAYRLSFWRVAAEEINYRRFFDINDLAAIRMELPEVFDAAHTLLLELVGSGAVTGLRIDHPDGPLPAARVFHKAAAALREGARAFDAGRQMRRVSRRREDPFGNGTAAERLAGARDNRLRLRTPREQSALRFIGRRIDDENVPSFHRPLDALRASRLREEAARHAPLARERRERPRQHARSAVGEEPLVPRLHARSARPRGPRDDRLLPSLPDLHHARRAGERCRSHGHRACCRRSQTSQPGDRRIGLQFPARYPAL